MVEEAGFPRSLEVVSLDPSTPQEKPFGSVKGVPVEQGPWTRSRRHQPIYRCQSEENIYEGDDDLFVDPFLQILVIVKRRLFA